MKIKYSFNGRPPLWAYVVTLLFVLGIVILVIGLCYFVTFRVVIDNWPAISAWGTNLVAGIQRGDPSSIFTAIVIAIVILFLIVRRPRTK